jgi:Fe-S-cluster-containing dehydrogenase component
MSKWNLIVDVAKCENCNNCALATKDEHVGNDFPGYAAPQPLHGHDWIRIQRKVRGATPLVDVAYMPTMCNHCDNAPCIGAAGDDSIRKRGDGIVIIDPVKARGRRDLVDSCPYGAISWNEELGLPQKWIFDAHLLDQGWKEPRCSQACPTAALRAIKVDDTQMAAIVKKEGLEVLHPELKTRPHVYYKNLHRFNKCFIAGSITAKVKQSAECISGAKIDLSQGGKQIASSVSDTFGDFKFDALAPSSGRYRIDISHAQFGKASVEAELVADASVYLGPVELAARH